MQFQLYEIDIEGKQAVNFLQRHGYDSFEMSFALLERGNLEPGKSPK
jgi:hypothetical protein